MKPFWISVALLSLAVFLGWNTLKEKLVVNLAGVEAMKACQQEKGGPAKITTPAIFGIGLHRCLGDQARLHESAREVIEKEPDRIRFMRAIFPDQLELAQYAVEVSPENPDAWFWLGDVYIRLNESMNAIAAYERGLSFRPEEADVWDVVARYYETQGDWLRAAQAFDMACNHMDQGKNGCPNAGRLYLAHGNFELAARSFRNSLYQLWGWQPAMEGLRSAALGLLDQGKADIAIPYLQYLAQLGDQEAQVILQNLEYRP